MDAVLKADYGDKDQKAKNDADVARVSAAGAGVRTMECSLPWDARFPRMCLGASPPSLTPIPIPLHQARARVKDPVVPAPAPKAYRPPFWESKRFGEPYGDFNREPPPRNVVRVAPTSPGRPHTTTRGEPADLTNRPAVSRSLNAMDASSAFAAARARAKAAKPVAVDDTRATGVMAAYTRNASCPSLPALEHRMRTVLKQGTQLHERDTDDLLRAFAEFGVSVTADAKERKTNDEARSEVNAIDRLGFVRAWRALGVAVTDAEAVAVFNKYGQTRAGLMPTRTFAEALLVPPARLSNMATAIRKGAFTREEATGRKKLVGTRAFQGKIVYPPCRKGVFTPSGFDGSALVRSASEADARLELEFVHGYARDCHANNLFYIKAARKDSTPEADEAVSSSTPARASAERTLGGSIPAEELAEDTEIVYCVAGLGVVYDKRRNAQRFFRGHTDDVKCLTVSRAKDLCASGQLGREPTAIVWDPYTCAGLKVLTHPRGTRGVAAVGFDRDAKTLATVGMDNNHTIFVWAWRSGTCVHQLRGHADVPPKVYGLVFDWVGEDPEAFLTYGVNHVKFWKKTDAERKTSSGTQSKQSREYVEESGKFGPTCKKHAVVSAVYLPSGRVLTGTPEGSIAVWSAAQRRITRLVRAHAPGPSVTRVDGPPTHHGVRCLRLRADGETLLSAGADGHVIAWDVKNGDLKESSVISATPVRSADGRSGAPPVFVGLDCSPNAGNAFVAGTDGSDVWEVVASSSSRAPTASSTEKRTGVAGASSSRVLVNGHSSDLYSVAWSPTEAATYATASEGETVNVWCAERRVLKRAVSLGNKARSVAFSPDGAHLAVGCVNGGVHVLDAATLTRTRWIKTHDRAVTDLKYSPDGESLAACSSDRRVDVYDVRKAYKLMAKCFGHGASVKHVDWSEDSRVLRASCAAYEILHFDPRGGKQIVSDNQRDTAWHTRTSPLGFDAMGIWRPGADGTDVNAVDRSRARAHLVTADDFGGVNVFNYPVVVDEAPSRREAGHSSHVMNVRFSPTDAWVVSVGGKDRAVFQWRFERIADRAKRPEPADPPWARVGEVDADAAAAAREKARLEARGGGAGENAPWARPPALDLALEDLPDLPAPGTDGGR